MDIQYFCVKLCQFYQEFINSSSLAERENLKTLVLFYLKCINGLIEEDFKKPLSDL